MTRISTFVFLLSVSTLTAMASPNIQVGKAAPDFELRDAQGATYELSSFRGKNPVVLEFFRSGGW